MNGNLFSFRATAVAACLLLLSGMKLFSAESDYQLSDDGTVLERYLGSEESFVVPDGVKIVGDFAFEGCSSLTSLFLPESVKRIERSAFAGCSGLTSITVPENVEEIGLYAFRNCSSLAEIVVAGNNSNFQSIDGVLFSKDGKKLYKFPEGMKKDTFLIPESVKTIEDEALFKARLKSIEVAKNNPDFKSINGVLFSKDGKTLIKLPEGSARESYVVPDGVVTIEKDAFTNSASLTEVVLPDGVKTIGKWAFANCSSLKNIRVPDSVSKIGDNAFAGCVSLTSFVVPKGIEKIAEFTFGLCVSLEEIVVSEGVQKIEPYAFAKCEALTIRAPKESYAERFAKESKIRFEAIE